MRPRNQTIHIIQDTQVDFKFPDQARQRQKHLSPTEAVALIQAHQAGSTMTELAQSYGIHRSTVAGWIERLTLPTRKRGLDRDELPNVIRQYQAGWSLARLGQHYGCDAETVRTALKRANIRLRPRRGWIY